MTRSDCPISKYFQSSCHDQTPDLGSVTAEVLYCPYSPDTNVTRLCATALSSSELKRAASHITSKLAGAFIQRRAFRRYCASQALENPNTLTDQTYAETKNGRPYLPKAPHHQFSFSSGREGFVGAWSKTHLLGVDIEDTSVEVEERELAKQFFSQSESRLVEQERQPQTRKHLFFQLWCLKEAALKSIGEGLPFGLEKFEFSLHPAAHLVNVPIDGCDLRNVRSQLINRPSSVVALVSHPYRSSLTNSAKER